MSNSIGKIYRLTTFGESHGKGIGGIIDGCPAGIKLDLKAIQNDLNRRKPGQSRLVTQRKEPDQVELLSGVFDGVTTGQPIAFFIQNQNQKSKDYSHIQNLYRPSHADYVYEQKYGVRDYRGGGRSSARETANWVVAGAIAKQCISEISIHAFVSSVGEVEIEKDYQELDFAQIEETPIRCPDLAKAQEMIKLVETIKKQGDTIGGTIQCVIQNVPIGWGEPIFDKLHARLGSAMLGINASKGFEYGSGFLGTKMKGSEHNDSFDSSGKTLTNFSGGIQGGISNGMEIYFKVGFKPVATLLQRQKLLSKDHIIVESQGKGRHDPCVVPRAVPIVEALSAMVLLDFCLLNETKKI